MSKCLKMSSCHTYLLKHMSVDAYCIVQIFSYPKNNQSQSKYGSKSTDRRAGNRPAGACAETVAQAQVLLQNLRHRCGGSPGCGLQHPEGICRDGDPFAGVRRIVGQR